MLVNIRIEIKMKIVVNMAKYIFSYEEFNIWINRIFAFRANES